METQTMKSGISGHGAPCSDFVRIDRSPTGHGFQLKAAQYLPHPRQRVFEFFSDASNLQILTPAWLHFVVQTPTPIRVENGTRIDYSLRMHGVPIRWQSLISHWEPPFRFVDEQTHGPYRSWRHEHTFEATPGGVICRDAIDYSVFGGSLIHTLFVRGDLSKIFAFRQRKLREFFPKSDSVFVKSADRSIHEP
jgi:ligand-binding SRPBCC domain-containing protein